MKAIIPPIEIWETTDNPATSDEQIKKNLQIRTFDSIEFPEQGGSLVYYKDYPYPQKVITHPVAVMKVAIVKRSLLMLLPFLWIKSIRNRWIEYAEMVIETHSSRDLGAFGTSFLFPHYYCDSAREIYRAGMKSVRNQHDKLLVKIICMIWEFDNSYRYQFQRAAGLIDKEMLMKQPIRELLRVADEVERRWGDNWLMVSKVKRIKRALMLAALLPKARASIRRIAAEIDFEKVKLDEIDRYWCSLRPNYDW